MNSKDNAFETRIGARQIGELLRFRCEPPTTKKIRLTAERSRHAYAVLMDKLNEIQKENRVKDCQTTLVQTIEEACEEFEIALPVAESDWGAILVLDEVYSQLYTANMLDNEALLWFEQLRIPTMRYALMDYSFFFAAQNLVRRLLNQCFIVFLSNTEQNRAVYRDYLAELGKRIQQEFKLKTDEIHSLCIEAQAFFASQNRKLTQIEAQLKVYESQKYKTKIAEQRVIELLNEKVAGRKLPEILIDFLQTHWRQSLLQNSMREGGDGKGWKRQVRVTESMVEFVEECGDPGTREKYRNFYSVMMKNISDFLSLSVADKQQLEKITDDLELVFNALIQGVELDSTLAPSIPIQESTIAEVSVVQASAQALALIDALKEGQWLRLATASGHREMSKIALKGEAEAPWVLISHNGKTVAKKTQWQLAQLYDADQLEIVDLAPWWNEALDIYFHKLQERWIEWQQQKEIEEAQKLQQSQKEEELKMALPDASPDTIPETEQSQTPLEAEVLNLEDQVNERHISEHELSTALTAVEQLQIGGWITYSDKNKEQRLKLAVKIKGRDKLVFVDRVGVRALEVNKLELARLLVQGYVTIVDVGAQFDSTLERIVRSIQSNKL